MKHLSKLDYLGPRLKMTINNQERFKSSIGGCFTLLWVLISTLAFYAFARDIIEKNHPQVVYNKKENPERIFTYKSNNFTFMLSFFDENFIPIQDVERKASLVLRIGNFKMNFENSQINSNQLLSDNYKGNSTNFHLVPCNSENYQSSGNEEKNKTLNFLLTKINYYWCPPPNLEFDLINGFGEANSQWLSIEIGLCKNNTNNNLSCFPSEKNYQELRNINIHYVISDINIDSYSYGSPGKPKIISGISKANCNFAVENINWYKSVYFDNDNNLIFESSQVNKYLQKDWVQTLYFPRENKNEDSGIFYTHIISISQEADFYNRSFLKIRGVIAYLGGSISLIRLFFKVFAEVLSEKQIIMLIQGILYPRPVFNPSSIKKNDKFNKKNIFNNFSRFKSNLYSNKLKLNEDKNQRSNDFNEFNRIENWSKNENNTENFNQINTINELNVIKLPTIALNNENILNIEGKKEEDKMNITKNEDTKFHLIPKSVNLPIFDAIPDESIHFKKNKLNNKKENNYLNKPNLIKICNLKESKTSEKNNEIDLNIKEKLKNNELNNINNKNEFGNICSLNNIELSNENEDQVQAKENKIRMNSMDLNLFKFLFPCFLKRNSLDRMKYDHLKKMIMMKNKFFSFEKIIKTIRNIKLVKKLIFNEEQTYFLKYSDLSNFNERTYFKKNFRLLEFHNLLIEKLRQFKKNTLETKDMKDKLKGVNVIEKFENANKNFDFRVNYKLIKSLKYLED